MSGHNIYSNPEAFGLRIFGEVDSGGGYDFDKLVVWQDLGTKELLWAHDSGCSCPTPFEDHDLTTLRPIRSREEAWAVVREAATSMMYGGLAVCLIDLLAKTIDHLGGRKT